MTSAHTETGAFIFATTLLGLVDTDKPSEIETALRTMLPSAHVVVTSFAGNLPSPAGLDSEERKRRFVSARREAIDHVIRALLIEVGDSANAIVEKDADGERIWPNGCVASLTHKGTFVLGAIAPITVHRAIGIDLECIQGGLAPVTPLIVPEGLPAGLDPETAAVVALSAKESAYKAFHRVKRERLTHADIRLTWTKVGTSNMILASCHGLGPIIVESQILDKWVVTAGMLEASREQDVQKC